MLFLGGGNFSLRRDPVSAACLLLSIAPRFPMRTIDHQYHLQALRHLYVLAAEPRALHTIDVDSGLTVSVNVRVDLVNGRVVHMLAPGLLPELSTIRTISVAAPTQALEGRADNAQVEYYPTSLELQSSTQGDADVAHGGEQCAKDIQKGAWSHSGSQKPIFVPPLFVKKIPRPPYNEPQPAPATDTLRRDAQPAVENTIYIAKQLLHDLSSPRSFREQQQGINTLGSPASEYTTGPSPAENLSSLLSNGDNSKEASGEVILGRALCNNEQFLQIILQSITA